MRHTFLLLLITFSVFSYAQELTKNFELASEQGKKAVIFLKNSEYDELSNLFSEKLRNNFSQQQMQQAFSGIQMQYGKIVEPLDFDVKETAEGVYYLQGLQFEKQAASLSFRLNKENEFISFRLVPYSAVYEWSPPNYSDESLFSEKKDSLGQSEPLMAKLTIPKKEKTKIMVVMVHGSGPNDMDESLGPNKFFKDLAYGLASQGISSLRYNKRSYDYPSAMAAKMNEITIDEIVTHDAVKAVTYAKKLGVEKIILVGHSLGGHMAPKIAAEAEPDGVIIMAGNVSPLQELIVDQYEYLIKNDPETSINELQLNMIKTQVKNVEENNYNKDTPAMMLPLGLPASFWSSMKDYSPTALSAKQDIPYLILNGGRDYQVTPEQAEMWEDGNKNSKSETIIYPKLNHMFFAGKGVLLPSEYEEESHIEETVINDIVEWIKAL